MEKVIMFGSRSSSCIPGDKKSSKWIFWGSKCLIPLHAATATECDTHKKTKRHAGYCTSEYIYLTKQLTS